MVVMNYRTEDGLADYGFSIEFWLDKGWRVFIAFRPLHQDHDDDLELSYQSVDDHGRHYVDWPAKIDSLGDAKTVAALWAELIQRRRRATKNSQGSDGEKVLAEVTAALAQRTALMSPSSTARLS